MRVITGKFRSRIIKAPRGVELRPTADRVKESLFAILGGFVIDKDCLDLFSGTGNLGIEAFSRGARSCVFIDANRRCTVAIKENIASLGIIEGAQVFCRDAFRFLKEAEVQGSSFDLIFLDPPYYNDLIKKALLTVDSYNIIKAFGIVIAEHHLKDELPPADELKRLVLFRQESYGGTILSFYHLKKVD
ncbi:MAG: 16S rRNA (guanine(966)-N(2))-methyltransferase RsmD [Candidatus Omnitrophota bacterium]